VGSRLFDVIDTWSKRTDTHRRFRATLRWGARLVLVSIAGSWLFLYLDSVYQRRRAEALFADLKSLDFETAGFPEVRDIMIRYGAHAMQSQLLPRLPDLGHPMIDNHGKVTFTLRHWPFCTPRDCTFQLQIMTRLLRIPLIGRTAEFFYTTLPYIGVRSWGAYAQFEVRNGKLYRSTTGAGEIRMERLDSSKYRREVFLGYEVQTWRESTNSDPRCAKQDYVVRISHGSVHTPANALVTCVLQSAGIPVKRAFDIHPRCLSGLFRSCSFEELAPSAWADYSAKDGTAGSRDPYK
jgi:hypothetical protein